jgi:hypothetical protein
MRPQDGDLKVRIPQSIIKRCDELIPLATGNMPIAGAMRLGRVSRTALIHFALVRGLETLEGELGRDEQHGEELPY